MPNDTNGVLSGMTNIPSPKPTTMRDFGDTASIRNNIYNNALDAASKLEPVSNTRHTMSIHDIHYHGPETYTIAQQKEAILKGQSLYRRLRGTVKLTDNATNDTLDEKTITLAKIPYMTQRGTFIKNGNEWTLAHQMRLRPGVYSRIRENGELESQVNLAGHGTSHKLWLDPAKNQFKVTIGQAHIPLLPLMRALGTTDKELREYWGDDILQRNLPLDSPHFTDKFLAKFVRRANLKDTLENKHKALKETLEAMKIDPEVTKRTLGKEHSNLNKELYLAASKKLLDIGKGKAEVDDRDHMALQTIMGPEDLIAERLLKDRGATLRRSLFKHSREGNLSKLQTYLYDKVVDAAITGSGLGLQLEEINPSELLDQQNKVTRLGQGGIPSSRNIPDETRNVQPSHLNIIDLVKSPECLSQDSEVFTKLGWKFWPDITESDELACLIDNTLEFHKPIKLHKSYYDGIMYGAKNNKLDYLVTPNHRMLVRPYGDPKSKWRTELAEYTNNRYRKLKCGGHNPYVGNDVPTFILPNIEKKSNNQNIYPPIDFNDWAEFIGWYMSEGCVTFDENNWRYLVRISQSKEVNPANCERISRLLDRLPFKWSFHSGNNFVIGNKILASYFNQFGFCYDKWIPEELLNCQIEARQRLFESLLLGDGRRHKTGKLTQFCSSSKKLTLDFQRLAFSLGYSTRISEEPDLRKPNYRTCYIVNIHSDNERTLIPSERTHKEGYLYHNPYYTTQYSNYVYCATVPGSLLYCRRGNSCGYWIGNSEKVGVDSRFAHAVRKGDDGKVYSPYRNPKTGKIEYLPPQSIDGKILAFPNELQKNQALVPAMVGGKVKYVPREKIDYEIPEMEDTFSAMSNMVPLKSATKGHRVSMGSRMLTQALPLRNAEAPLVRAAMTHDPNMSFEEFWGEKMGAVKAKKGGRVTSVTPEAIIVKNDDGTTDTHELYNQFPYSRKTFVHNTPLVGVGDRFSPGQVLAKSNYTDDKGATALGINAKVAFIPWKGKNYEDAVVISEAFAKKLASEHMYQHNLSWEKNIKSGKSTWASLFPSKYPKKILDTIDGSGAIKPGTIVNYGDPLVLASRVQTEGSILYKKRGASHKDISLTWDHHVPGIVTDVANTEKGIAVNVKSYNPTLAGDKMANRFGGKGVIAELIPNEHMPRDSNGEPFEMLLNPLGVISRCYDDQTEFLTNNGWKLGKDVLEDDELMEFEPATKQLRFTKQSDRIFSNHFEGELYQFDNQYLNFAVTPGHKFWARCDYPTSPWQQVAVEKIAEFHRWLIPIAKWSEKEKSYVYGYKASRRTGWTRPKYSGMVYCPSVSTGYVVSRRNGLTLVAGNTNPSQVIETALGKIAAKTGQPYKISDFKNIPDLTEYAMNELKKHNMSDTEDITDPVTGRKIPGVLTGRQFFMKLHHTSECYDDKTEVLTKTGWVLWSEVRDNDYLATVDEDKLIFEKPIRLMRYRYDDELYCFDSNFLDYAVTPNHRMYVKKTMAKNYKFIEAEEVHGKRFLILQFKFDPEAKHEGMSLEGNTCERALSYSNFTKKQYNGTVYCAEMRTGLLYVRRNGKSMLCGNSKEQGRGVGGKYTDEDIPAKGGEEGSKRMALMSTMALLSSGSTEVIRDAHVVRGQKNEDYWSAFQRGVRPPDPKVPLIYQKFIHSLQGAGINVLRSRSNPSQLHIMALRDQDVEHLAQDREIKNAETINWKGRAFPYKGGLFDENLFGKDGNQWAYMQLHEAMPSPVMEEPIIKLLELTKDQFHNIIASKQELNGITGPKAIGQALKNIDVPKELEKVRAEIASDKKTARDKAIKKLGYLKAAQKAAIHPGEWMLSKVPVIPWKFRPVSVMESSGTPLVRDANYLYKEVFEANDNLKNAKELLGETGNENLTLYNAFKGVVGLGDPVQPKNREKKVKGLLKEIFGTNAKYSTIQQKLLGANVDAVGRATITPNPDLDMDHVALPEDKAWSIYQPFIIRNLTQKGIGGLEAAKYWKDRHAMAAKSLEEEMLHRPVIIDRAPILHRYGLMAFWPRLTKGHTLQISPIVTKGFGADFDGDAMQFHVPATDEAIEEAMVKMLPSVNLFSTSKFRAHYLPQQEYVGGLYHATAKKAGGRPRVFATKQDAVRAYRKGEIGMDHPIQIIQD